MKTIHKLAAALLLGAGALGLAGCATGLRTQVSRYQAMPVPAGQTFYVVPAEGTAPGLEFNRYAAIVSQQLAAKGYTPAGAPQLANMLVRLDYGVDEGAREYTTDPFARSRYGYGGFGDPFYRGYRDPFRRSYYDPFYDRHFGRPSTSNGSSPSVAYSPDAFLRRGRLAFFAAVRCFFAAISIGTMSGVPDPSYGLGCLYVNR